MKKLLGFSVIITALALSSCATKLTDISDAIGKEWKLIDVSVNNKNTEFNRKTLEKDGYGNIFTITINEKTISGVGAPNRYSAPYTVSKEDRTAVTIEVVRSTLMASIYHPEKLREHDFFVYIQNTDKWGLADGKLELHSKNNEGAPVVMKFSL